MTEFQQPTTPRAELLMHLEVLNEFSQEMEQATEDFHGITASMLPRLLELARQL